jgi:hypothetical protein
MPQGLIVPNNAILYAGQPVIQEMEVLTTTEFCPGKLVMTDTTDYQCKASTTATPTVLGVADVPSDQKLTDYYTESAGGAVTKEFTVKDQIRVLRGDIVVKVILLSGEDVDVGERLVSAANGMVAACTGDSGAPEDIVGYSLQDTGGAATTCKWILMKMTI